MIDLHANLIMDPGSDPGALSVDPIHVLLADSGYELRGGAWWRKGKRVGLTRLAMLHRDCLMERVTDSIELLSGEGYRVVSEQTARDMEHRVWPLVVLMLTLGFLLGIAMSGGI